MVSAVITHATSADCDAVAELAARTFSETFGHLYTAKNLASHLAKTCSAEYFRDSLKTGDTLLMAHVEGKLIGYGKVGWMRLPVTPMPPGAVEIHRVYVDKTHQGHGYGKALMLYILSLPAVRTAPIVYLSVWEENLRAQALYNQYGFVPAGRYLYYVGTQADHEIIMARHR
jgi:ribosomal protein S18 acetylase RimI-like enzyme